jgi:uncharacterized metal-binding protein YceD (DUF177 family)
MRRFIERLGLTAGAYVSMIAVYMETMEQNFSRTVRAGHIKEAPQEHVVLADEAFRAELAALYGLPGISLLRGEFVLQHERGGVIAAKLRMQARVTQSCVVSLEPFEAKIDEQSALRFVPAKNLPEGESAELDAETLEGPDEIPYTGDMIDLRAALAEQLALALDPYPRKPGAALPDEFSAGLETPFSVLKGKWGK